MQETAYPSIGDYAFLSDCHSAALVSSQGSIDWCCMPRLDGDTCFGRLLDWETGGYCRLAPAGPAEVERRYLERTLVLETRFRTETGQVRLLDAMAMRLGGRRQPYRQVIRHLEGVAGEVEMDVAVVPRFDFGSTRPWIRRHGPGHFTAIGGDDGLVIRTDLPLEAQGRHDLLGRVRIAAGETYRLGLQYVWPPDAHPEAPEPLPIEELDRRFQATVAWWHRWCRRGEREAEDPSILRSALVIRGLVHAPTGAIAAAATTSLPECIGGSRNWDYRYSWLRDSSFVLSSLGKLGFSREAHGFRLFLERTTAGNADEVQPLYGIRGEHLLPEFIIHHMEGYRGSSPVRIGNGAYLQRQLDSYGELVDLAWRAAQRGHRPSEDYWRFLRDVVEHAIRHWREPDRGLWEVRDRDHHFVHSKVTCWAAVDRGLRIAEHCGLEAPRDHWRRERRRMRRVIERCGYDRSTGTFVRDFEDAEVDAALLLLPRYDFVAYDDPRMVRTVERIRRELGVPEGRLRRYLAHDGLEGSEGCFIACSFWLVECLALQGRVEEAQAVFEQASGFANDLGLFSEEIADDGTPLGNVPQGLSHYAHISAALALSRHRPPQEPEAGEDGGEGVGGPEEDREPRTG